MIWYTKKNEQEQIQISRTSDPGTIIWQISCYDDEDENNHKKERELIQNFINQVIQNSNCTITGLFCEKYLDDMNKKNIERKIETFDNKLIKWNKKRQKKKMPEVNYYYLKGFDISLSLFEMAPWDFDCITIWPKENFNENMFWNETSAKILCNISIEEITCISLYISDELAKYRDNLFKELQNLGYQIVERKTLL